MKRAHCVIVRGCSWLAGHTGALIVGLAVVWMTSAPRPLWGQWSTTNPVWTYSNVGIGTNAPATTLHLFTTGYTQATSETTTMFAQYRLVSGSRRYQLATAGSVIGAPYTGAFYIHDETAAATRLLITSGGNVGIGTTNPGIYRLAVEGTIAARDVMVTNAPFADYVFQPGYHLRPLSEIGAYIRANHHLPDIPSEAEVKEKGVSVGDMQSKLLAKVEELTLHMIQAEERNNRLEEQNRELRDRIGRLEKGAAASATPTAAK